MRERGQDPRRPAVDRVWPLGRRGRLQRRTAILPDIAHHDDRCDGDSIRQERHGIIRLRMEAAAWHEAGVGKSAAQIVGPRGRGQALVSAQAAEERSASAGDVGSSTSRLTPSPMKVRREMVESPAADR